MTTNNSKNGNKANPQEDAHDARLVEAIHAWMVVRLSDELNVAPAEIDVHESLLNYGLNSIVAFTLTGELADLVGRELPATLFWDFPTVEAVGTYLISEIKDGQGEESLLVEINYVLSRIEELPEDEILESEKNQK